jgi:hypothetical protein
MRSPWKDSPQLTFCSETGFTCIESKLTRVAAYIDLPTARSARAPTLLLLFVVPVVAAGRGGSEADAPAESTDEAVLAATAPADPGETVTVTSEAPSKPGACTYVCTYPGHCATMQGTMRVVNS